MSNTAEEREERGGDVKKIYGCLCTYALWFTPAYSDRDDERSVEQMMFLHFF